MRRNLTVFALTGPMILIAMTHTLLAQGGANCRNVGGSISTNFLDQANTLGSATGDLKGGLGVTVLGVASQPDGSLVFNNQHRWVTDSGDTISFDNASATAYPTASFGLYALRYTDGMTITGGTGRFAGASGKIATFGAVDLIRQEVILRYEGQICSPPVQVNSNPK